MATDEWSDVIQNEGLTKKHLEFLANFNQQAIDKNQINFEEPKTDFM